MYMVYLYDLDDKIMKEYGPMTLDMAWEIADTYENMENRVEVLPAS